MTVGNRSDFPEESQDNLSGEWTDPQWVGAHPAAFGQLAPEDVVGRCKVVRELGTGGMGAVYLATHTTLQIDVALKILPPAMARERVEIAQRFIREAQLAARIRHPNVVSVMDADFDQSTGLYYIVFEYISGGSLAQRLRQGPLPESEALRIILDIAQALVVAAEHKIVHRDIKPDNIMLDHRGNAKLADLGLAKQDFAAAQVQLTQTGASVGTPSYMSPEQIRDAQNVDAQDDIYSLGATLYECLTGTPPYAAANPYNAVGQILFSPTPDPRAIRSDISPELAEVCKKMMAKKKEDRYRDALSLVDDLQALKHSSTFGGLIPEWARRLPQAAVNPQHTWLANEISKSRRKLKFSDLLLFAIVLAVTVWVVRAMLIHEEPPVTSTPASQPPTASASATSAPSDPVLQAPRALPVEGESAAHTPEPTPLPFPAQPTPIALPPPEPIAGEEPPAAPAPDIHPQISAFQAKALAEQMIPEAVRGNLMQITGPRRPGSPTPASWRFLYWDPTADQHVRAVTVTDGVAAPAKEGFVELGKLRVVSYKKNEIVAPARLLIDSTKALEILQATPQLQNVPITSANYFLDKGKGDLPPVWRLTLFTKRNNDEIQLGEVRVLADTGLILEFGIKLNRLPAQP